ncbi:MAG TPA: NADH-quinone oxidoreductase subunit NuoN [Alphaproteobacteria bacterium]|nr:NADH-quinone oxidoreductase subunit NuoN [Alphaproteobacteria bacterium]
MNLLSNILDINLVFPEIFLSLWLLVFIPLGVYSGGDKETRQSYFTIFSIIGLLGTLLIILMGDYKAARGFYDLIVNDRLVVFLKSLVILAGVIVLIISEKYRTLKKLYLFEYPVLILFSILGMLVMLSSNDFITLYLGLELQSLSLYVLAAIKKDSLKSSEAGLKYFILGALASGFFLFGVSLLFGITGTTSFTILSSNLLSPENNSLLLILSIVLILSSIAFKLSIAPFHMWTPDVYEGAPTSVTAFFAVVPKIAAIGVLMRILYIALIDIHDVWNQLILILGILSIFVGAFGALLQINIKRLMAYSAISNIGYIFLALSLGSQLGLEASLIYITVYTVSALGSFAFILSMEKDNIMLNNISSFAGLSKSNPFYAICFSIILLSLAGLPPLAGFIAKFYIFKAVIMADFLWIAVIGIMGSVISAYYYLNIVKVMYLDEAEELFTIESKKSVKFILFISAVLIFTFLIYADSLINFLSYISKAIIL